MTLRQGLSLNAPTESPTQSLERRVRDILHSELRAHAVEYTTASATVYDNVRTVGVQGDERTYDNPVEISIETPNGRYWNPDVLARISVRITNELKGINRVVYNVTEAPSKN